MDTVRNQSVPSVTLESAAPVTEGGINIAKRYPDRSDNLYFLFIPLAVLVTVMLLSVVVSFVLIGPVWQLMSNGLRP